MTHSPLIPVVTRHLRLLTLLVIPWLWLGMSATVLAETATCSNWSDGLAAERQGGLEGKSESPNEALVFGHITIRTGDLFDLSNSSESAFVHSTANALHLNTREATVYNALPFSEGESFSLEKLAEAERILRKKRYLRDAFATPHHICGNRVDVEIRTIDNWTLTPSISVGSAGGQSRYSFELQDLNVLGLGKEMTLRNSRSGDEQTTLFRYLDENVWGSRYRFLLDVADVDGNQGYGVEFGLPFYAEDADHAWSVKVSESTNSLKLSSAADATAVPPLAQTRTHVELLRTRLLRTSNLPLARLGVGLRLDQEETQDAVTMERVDNETDFEEVYPFLHAQWSQSRWIKRQNYGSLRKTEDIDLGLSVSADAGLILQQLGNDQDALRLSLDISQGWYTGESSLHKLSFQQVQYFSSEDQTRQDLHARYQYFHWLSDVDQLDLRLTGEMSHGHSDFDNFALGGEDGLRAYPNRFQVGDRRILGVVEYRHVTRWSPWSLVHAAFTGFAEAGRAWSDGTEADTLVNVGTGLLLSPTRSSRASINRFDISFPLTSNDEIDSFQIFVGSRINF